MRDHSANRNARKVIQQGQNFLKYFAADIFKININSIRTRIFKCLCKVRTFVIDTSIKAEFLGDKSALFRRPRNADCTRTFNFCDLPNNRTDCSGCGGDYNRFTFFGLTNVKQTGVCRNSGHTQNSGCSGNWCKLRINFSQRFTLRCPIILPAP